jgi:hypothetical protein
MRKLLMSTSGHQHQDFSDATIRRFLLAQLSRAERSVFETALFTYSQLEHRARLVEIELIDDYAADRLRANERAAFQQKFLVTAARQKKLEVSAALQRSLANGLASQRMYRSKRLHQQIQCSPGRGSRGDSRSRFSHWRSCLRALW